jgi:hypothetical protein
LALPFAEGAMVLVVTFLQGEIKTKLEKFDNFDKLGVEGGLSVVQKSPVLEPVCANIFFDRRVSW